MINWSTRWKQICGLRGKHLESVMFRLVGWTGTLESKVIDRSPSRNYRRWVFGFTVVTVVLFLLVGAVKQWRHGGGQNSDLVDALWHTIWICYTLAKLGLIALLFVAGYRHFKHR